MSALPQPTDNKSWQALLELGFVARKHGTVLQHTRHQGPLRVQRPFYPEDGLPHVYLLHPPGGVVAGDQLNINIHMHENSRALITTPGSTKFYRSNHACAEVRQTLVVNSNASLEWFPQENIFFSRAKARCHTRIELDHSATFIGWELLCLGRPSNAELFEQGQLFSQLELFRAGRPRLRETLRILSTGDLHAISGLRSYPMMAMFIATPCDETQLAIAREMLERNASEHPIAATLVEDMLIIRALGHQTEAIQKQLIPIWQALRPTLLSRQAILPRIWAT